MWVAVVKYRVPSAGCPLPVFGLWPARRGQLDRTELKNLRADSGLGPEPEILPHVSLIGTFVFEVHAVLGNRAQRALD